jgi:hypothetical protein
MGGVIPAFSDCLPTEEGGKAAENLNLSTKTKQKRMTLKKRQKK